MDLQEPERKEPPESVIPMINVVFLLLIFFLISATLTPPVDATPPVSAADGERADPPELVIDKSGAIVFGALRGEDALAAAAAAHKSSSAGANAPFALLADAEAPGAALSKAMRGLAIAEVRKVALTTLRAAPASAADPECAAGGDTPC